MIQDSGFRLCDCTHIWEPSQTFHGVDALQDSLGVPDVTLHCVDLGVDTNTALQLRQSLGGTAQS